MNNLNCNELDKFLMQFNVSNNLYFLDILKMNYLYEAQEYTQQISNYSTYLEDDLLRMVNNIFKSENVNIIESIKIFFAIDKKRNDRDFNIYEAKIYNLIVNMDLIIKNINDIKDNIDISYFELPLELIIKDQLILDILFINGISTINNLICLSTDILIILFSKNIEEYCKLFCSMNDTFDVDYKNKFKKIFKEIKPKYIEVLKCRNGFNCNSLTLEEVGNKYGVTRERIRQIQNKGIKKIQSYFSEYENIIIRMYFYLVNNNKYISKDEFENYIKNQDITLVILVMMGHPSSVIKFDDNYNVIYNSKLFSIDELEKEVFNKFENTISKYEFNETNSFEKKVIEFNYRETKTGIYIKKNANTSCLITELIDELFPEGYRISNNDDYNLLVTSFKNRYGEENEISSPRAVTGIIERYDYCQIDRGMYKKIDYCVKLDDELINAIIEYILLNKPIVYYQSIYEHFKDELLKQGINNYFYLKGLIDPKFPKEFKTKRNYINVGETNFTGKKAIIHLLKSFDDIFNYNDIKVKFEGISDYIIDDCLYSEFKNGLLRLNNNNFIYIDKLHIDNVFINELSNYIYNTFKLMDTKVLNVKTIYDNLLYNKQNILHKLKYIDCPFSLFSLLKYLYNDKFFFSRPVISLEENSSFANEKLTMDYALELEFFNIKIIKKYQEKMNFRFLYSYLNFMEVLSEEFVQIDIDAMIRKDKFQMDNDLLYNINSKLNLIFTKFDLIDTRTFNSFSIFPKLNYNWNKYLLIGIIRTFLSNQYKVENTNYQYKLTDYIIRKIN